MVTLRSKEKKGKLKSPAKRFLARFLERTGCKVIQEKLQNIKQKMKKKCRKMHRVHHFDLFRTKTTFKLPKKTPSCQFSKSQSDLMEKQFLIEAEKDSDAESSSSLGYYRINKRKKSQKSQIKFKSMSSTKSKPIVKNCLSKVPSFEFQSETTRTSSSSSAASDSDKSLEPCMLVGSGEPKGNNRLESGEKIRHAFFSRKLKFYNIFRLGRKGRHYSYSSLPTDDDSSVKVSFSTRSRSPCDSSESESLNMEIYKYNLKQSPAVPEKIYAAPWERKPLFKPDDESEIFELEKDFSEGEESSTSDSNYETYFTFLKEFREQDPWLLNEGNLLRKPLSITDFGSTKLLRNCEHPKPVELSFSKSKALASSMVTDEANTSNEKEPTEEKNSMELISLDSFEQDSLEDPTHFSSVKKIVESVIPTSSSEHSIKSNNAAFPNPHSQAQTAELLLVLQKYRQKSKEQLEFFEEQLRIQQASSRDPKCSDPDLVSKSSVEYFAGHTKSELEVAYEKYFSKHLQLPTTTAAEPSVLQKDMDNPKTLPKRVSKNDDINYLNMEYVKMRANLKPMQKLTLV